MLAEYSKAAVAERFSRAAERYQQHANIQQVSAEILRDLLSEHLSHNFLPRERADQPGSKQNTQTGTRQIALADSILDLGCGPGTQTAELQAFAKNYVGIDIALGMLAKATQMNSADANFLQADMESLPFAPQQFNLVYSNLAVQWSNNPLQLLLELKRITKPGGVIAVATVLDGSLEPLAQLRRDFLKQPAVNQQPKITDWLAWCTQAQLTCVYQEERRLAGWFADVPSVLRSISAIGADHQRSSQVPKLGMAEYNAICKGYEHYRTIQGLPLHYQVGFLILEV